MLCSRELHKARESSEGIAERPVAVAALGADGAALVQLVDVSLGALYIHIGFCNVLAFRAIDEVICKAVVYALFPVFLPVLPKKFSPL